MAQGQARPPIVPRIIKQVIFEIEETGTGPGTAPTISIGPNFGGNNGDQFFVGYAVSLGNIEANFDFILGLAVTLPNIEINYTDITLGLAVTLPSVEIDYTTLALGLAVSIPNVEIDYTELNLGLVITLPNVEANYATLTAGLALTGTAEGNPFFQSNVTNANAGAATTLVINKPANVLEGHFLLALIHKGDVTNNVTSTGWTVGAFHGGNGHSVTALYKFATGSEPGSYTFNFASSNAGGSIFHYLAVNTTTPINVSAGSNNSAKDPVTASITTTVANCDIVLAVSQAILVAAHTFTPPAGYSERYDTDAGGVLGHKLTAARKIQAAAAANGAQTFTKSSIGATNYATLALAIAPAAFTL